MYHGTAGRLGYARVALVAAVVEMVSVAVPAVVPLMLTGLVEPKLNVGRYCAPDGLEVTVPVSAMLPVNPPVGVRVTTDVFPVVAPRETVTAVPLTVKFGFTAVVIVTGAVPVFAL